MTNKHISEKTFASRFFAASSWLVFGVAGEQLLRLGANLIMTRLLVPELFGVMALTNVAIVMITLISDVGIGPNIVRSRRGEEPNFLNTAWSIQVIRSVVIFLAIILLAQLLRVASAGDLLAQDSAYAHEQLPLVLTVLAFNSLITGFNSTNILLTQRKMLLGRLTILKLTSQVFSTLIMVAWAYIDRSIWALVSANFSYSLLFLFLSHYAFPGEKNKFVWDRSASMEILHFGKWIMVSSILAAFYGQGDRLILGGLVSAELVGIYSIAFFLSFSVLNFIQQFSSNIAFPALGEISRSNKQKLLETYYKIRKNIDSLAMLCAGGIFASGELIVEILYDDRYLEAGWMLQIMCLSLMFTSPYVSNALMLAIGRSKFGALMKTLQTVVLFTALPILHNIWGMEGFVWGIVLVPFLSFILDLLYRKRLNMMILKNEFRMYPVVLAGFAAGSIFNQIVYYVTA